MRVGLVRVVVVVTAVGSAGAAVVAVAVAETVGDGDEDWVVVELGAVLELDATSPELRGAPADFDC